MSLFRGGRGGPAGLAGLAAIVGGVGWATLAVLTLATDLALSPLWYGAFDPLTPLALALLTVGLAGYRVRASELWGRFTAIAFILLVAGLLGALAGSVVYVAAGVLAGWTVSVWSYFLAIVGATAFGVGLLFDRAPPRSGAALLAGTFPVGLAASLALAVGVVPDEAIVPVGPAVLLGVGVAALGWWSWRN